MLEKLRQKLLHALPTLRALGRWLGLAGLAGAACGLAGAAFTWCVAQAAALRAAHPWLLFAMPLAGLAIVWSYRAAGMENDSGTNQIIASVRGGERPPVRLAPLIFLGSVLTHLTGGSAGREGAALQIGGSISAGIGRLLRLGDRNVNTIIQCGMAGLFSALFGTPLTATVFALEVVNVGHFRYAALFPCLLSALTANAIPRLLGLPGEAYHLSGLPEPGLGSMLRCGALAILAALVSIAFCVLMHEAGRLYKKYIPDQYLRGLAGAALVIALTLAEGSGDYNGAGGHIIELAVEGQVHVPWAFLWKMLFTALTLGAGFRGGEIVPTLFIGSTFGCAAGPLLGLDPAFGAAVSMIALFCGVVNCPMASIFLAIELFGGEGLLFFALACALSFLVSGQYSLYSSQNIVYSKLEARLNGPQ
ncbi:MAG: chloride channel protein [Oscillospiraceae bacterium]|nr:chloride channel protein [Oscillospiraceae bacterium]